VQREVSKAGRRSVREGHDGELAHVGFPAKANGQPGASLVAKGDADFGVRGVRGLVGAEVFVPRRRGK
jgi:hypothetical protein